jgi:hypothetical protein
MQCACASLSHVPFVSLQYFSTLSLKRRNFRKENFIEYAIFIFLIFSTTFFETFLIIGTTERDVIQNVCWASCKVNWSEGLSNRVSIIIRRYTDNMNFPVSLIFFGSILYHCVYGCMFCMLLLNFVNYVLLFVCMFRSRYCVSLCCSMYCFCLRVYRTTATGYQPKCS